MRTLNSVQSHKPVDKRRSSISLGGRDALLEKEQWLPAKVALGFPDE